MRPNIVMDIRTLLGKLWQTTKQAMAYHRWLTVARTD